MQEMDQMTIETVQNTHDLIAKVTVDTNQMDALKEKNL